jgi:hypothetical protein
MHRIMIMHRVAVKFVLRRGISPKYQENDNNSTTHTKFVTINKQIGIGNESVTVGPVFFIEILHCRRVVVS